MAGLRGGMAGLAPLDPPLRRMQCAVSVLSILFVVVVEKLKPAQSRHSPGHHTCC